MPARDWREELIGRLLRGRRDVDPEDLPRLLLLELRGLLRGTRVRPYELLVHFPVLAPGALLEEARVKLFYHAALAVAHGHGEVGLDKSMRSIGSFSRSS